MGITSTSFYSLVSSISSPISENEKQINYLRRADRSAKGHTHKYVYIHTYMHMYTRMHKDTYIYIFVLILTEVFNVVKRALN